MIAKELPTETHAAPASPVLGRFAPSPTGLLHLGNAWAFLLAWLSARSKGGQIILRMEDLDPQRSRPAFAAAILDDLAWLGLDWDYGPDSPTCCPISGPFVQSQRNEIYASALARLEATGQTYPCFCSRKDLQILASAPHSAVDGAAFNDPCLHLTRQESADLLASGRQASLRLHCPAKEICFSDAVMGSQCFSREQFGGDFALRRADGVMAYQLAVAVDDGLMGVTEVVRGRDLLPSTPRQLLVMRLLGLPTPDYAHIPLLLDASGERLAKRHASLSLSALRASGVRPEKIVGYLARLAGINPLGANAHPRELVCRFSFDALPRADLRVMDEDMEYLMKGN